MRIAGEVRDFEPKKILTGKDIRKSLRMMARPVQMGVACAQLAFADAGVERAKLDSTRFGIEIGSSLIPTGLDDIAPAAKLSAISDTEVDYVAWGQRGIPEIQPLWMLQYLPNMVACHTSILLDAQGPNNSITETDVAGLLALGEAGRILRRDAADFMLVGASDSKIARLSFVRHCLFTPLSRRNEEPRKACRPFDANRDGLVIAEGAGLVALEELSHARARNARIYGELAGFGSAFDRGKTGSGVARAIRAALAQAGIAPTDIDHVNAHATGTDDDAWEARGIAEVFGRQTPVVAYKGHLGNLSSAANVVELAGSLLALKHGTLPPTINCDDPDPACGINVSREPRPVTKPYALKLSLTERGQAAAAVIRRWED